MLKRSHHFHSEKYIELVCCRFGFRDEDENGFGDGSGIGDGKAIGDGGGYACYRHDYSCGHGDGEGYGDGTGEGF